MDPELEGEAHRLNGDVDSRTGDRVSQEMIAPEQPADLTSAATPETNRENAEGKQTVDPPTHGETKVASSIPEGDQASQEQTSGAQVPTLAKPLVEEVRKKAPVASEAEDGRSHPTSEARLPASLDGINSASDPHNVPHQDVLELDAVKSLATAPPQEHNNDSERQASQSYITQGRRAQGRRTRPRHRGGLQPADRLSSDGQNPAPQHPQPSTPSGASIAENSHSDTLQRKQNAMPGFEQSTKTPIGVQPLRRVHSHEPNSNPPVPPPAPLRSTITGGSPYAQRLRRKQSLDSPQSTKPTVALTGRGDEIMAQRMRRKQGQDVRANNTVVSGRGKLASEMGLSDSRVEAVSRSTPLTCEPLTQSGLPGDGLSQPHNSASIGAANNTTTPERSNVGPRGSTSAVQEETTLPILSRRSTRSMLSPGADEGDRLVAALTDGGLPETTLRYSDAVPDDHQDEQLDSISRLPMETRGSFIDGGQGPLISDSAPGAFSAPGRAFGDLPHWVQNRGISTRSVPTGRTLSSHSALMSELSSRSLKTQSSSSFTDCSTRELRLTTPHGSFTVQARMRRTSTSVPEGVSSRGLALARATPLEHGASENDLRLDRSHDLADIPLEGSDTSVGDAAVETTTVVSAEEVKNEYLLQEANAKLILKFICYLIACLSLVLVTLLIATAVYEDDEPSGHRNKEWETLFPRNSTLPRQENLCLEMQEHSFHDYSPLLECYCSREIPGFPADVLNEHAYYVRLLNELGILAFNPLPTDCMDPKNLALLWMAEAEPKHQPMQNIIARFLLAVLFHNLDGLNWRNHTRWLTTHNECAWYGVRCNSMYVIEEIHLANNWLDGTIPSEVAEFTDLRILNLTQNINMTGDIPISVYSKLGNPLILVVDGTSVSGYDSSND